MSHIHLRVDQRTRGWGHGRNAGTNALEQKHRM